MSTGNRTVDQFLQMPAASVNARVAREREQLWAPFERRMAVWLAAGGTNPPEAVSKMMALLKAIYVQYLAVAEEKAVALPIDADPLARIQEWERQMLFGLLKEIAIRQIVIGELTTAARMPSPAA